MENYVRFESLGGTKILRKEGHKVSIERVWTELSSKNIIE